MVDLFKKYKLLIISFILFILVMMLISVFLYEPFMGLIDYLKANKEQFVKSGLLGYLAFSIIVALQVVVAILPGEPVEICAGFIFGSVNGLFCCLLGSVFASCIIYIIVRTLKRSMASNELVLKYLNDSKQLPFTIFMLFFIPGTPKDIITYVVPLTKMKLLDFITISSVARIPSIISSTLAGSTLENGDLNLTIMIFIITGILSLIGLYFYNLRVNS